MKNELISIVVVRWRHGFVAHVRFADPKDDADLSSHNRDILGQLIDQRLKERLGKSFYYKRLRDFQHEAELFT